MRRSLAVVALAVVLPLADARAEKVTIETGPFAVSCTGATQLCDPPQTLAIGDPAKKLTIRKIVYEASAEHCSAGRLLIDLDGQPFGKMKFVIGRERSTLRKRRALAPGTHTLAFRFEGRTGGCNAGYVASWGGAITVTARR